MNPEHEHDDDCEHGEVDEGAAIFPLIPAELNIHPLFLAALHAIVFFDGSEPEVIADEAADESLNYMATYLQRLRGPELQRLREDLDVLVEYGKEQDWPPEVLRFFRSFLEDWGIGQN